MPTPKLFGLTALPRLQRSVAEDEALPPSIVGESAQAGEATATTGAFPQEQEPAQTAIAPAEVDETRQELARRYARQRQTLSMINLAISAIVIVVLLFTGLNFGLRDALGGVSAWSPVWGWQPLKIAAYFGVLFAVAFVLGLPLGYYGGYTLPRRYGMSTQSLRGWLIDQAKELALSLVFELAAVEALYALLGAAPLTWWLWAGGLALLVTVVLANLLPIIILPLFYKLTPLPEGDVRERLLARAQQAHTRVRGAYSMNMSARTTAANAMVMGLGNTRRIVLGDTLLDRYTPDEIEVVVAHELGHQVHNDIPKLIAVQTIVMLGGLYVVNVALHTVVGAVPGYHGLNDSATMPLIAAALGVFGLVTLPLVNGFSRWVEHQADVYALESTGKTDAFIGAMTRLANQNLAELSPSPIVEFLLYNHPSIGKRLAYARNYQQTHHQKDAEQV